MCIFVQQFATSLRNTEKQYKTYDFNCRFRVY